MLIIYFYYVIEIIGFYNIGKFSNLGVIYKIENFYKTFILSYSYFFVFLSINLSIYRSIYLYIVLSIHPSIYLSINISIYLSIYPSIYPGLDMNTWDVPEWSGLWGAASCQDWICQSVILEDGILIFIIDTTFRLVNQINKEV